LPQLKQAYELVIHLENKCISISYGISGSRFEQAIY
jgi:hypothetical protein